MKRSVLALVIALLACSSLAQQPTVSIRNGTADPATCKPGSTNIFYRSDTAALKVCSALNTWTAVGGGGGTGTVTSVGLAGTANQITVTGTSPITTSGSWTLSFPVGGVTLPGTTTGTFSGNLTGNVTGNTSGSSGSTTGNAATATILQTARTINGDSFDGSGNIQNTLASADFANQGTTTTILHGNAAGNPSFGSVVNADITANTIDVATKLTGTLLAAQEPAHTGDTTNSAGSLAMSVKQLHLTQTAITFASSPYTVVSADSVITCDASSGAVVINLPAASGSGRYITIKKIDSSSNACTPTRAGSDLIDGAASYGLTTQYAASNVLDTSSGVWSRGHVNQLGGDLSGVSTAAKVNALESATTSINVSSATAPTNGQVLTATGGTAATWQTSSTFTPPTGTGAVTVTSGALDAASTAFSGTGSIAKVTQPTFVTDLLTPRVIIGTGRTTSDLMLMIDPSNANTILVSDGTAVSARQIRSGPIASNAYYIGNSDFAIGTTRISGSTAGDGGIGITTNSVYKSVHASALYLFGASNTTKDTNLSRQSAGTVGIGIGTDGSRTGFYQQGGDCFVSTAATNNTATMATSTCLVGGSAAITVTSGRKYSFTCEFFLSDSVSVDGAQIDFNGGTATATDFRAQITAFDTALNLSSQIAALATAASASTFTGNGAFEVHGSFEPSSNGTFLPRFAQVAHTTGVLTLARGSNCRMHEM